MISSCKEDTSYSSKNSVDVSDNRLTALDGKKIMEQKCYVCHKPEAGIDQRIGPPMVAIKSHYLEDNLSKDEFSDRIWNFVEQPREDKAKMKGAVKRFGLMPYQPFEEDEIRAIAEYIYEYKIEEPDWFKSHMEDKSHDKTRYNNEGKTEDSLSEVTKKTCRDRNGICPKYKKAIGQKPYGYHSKKRNAGGLEILQRPRLPYYRQHGNRSKCYY